MFLPDVVVILPECRGDMHQPGPVFKRDVVTGEDIVHMGSVRDLAIPNYSLFTGGEVKQRFILPTEELMSFIARRHLRLCIAKHFRQKFRREDEMLSLMRNNDVIVIFAHSDSDVRRQRPWGGCPDEQVGILLIFDWEFHVNRGVCDGFVTE